MKLSIYSMFVTGGIGCSVTLLQFEMTFSGDVEIHREVIGANCAQIFHERKSKMIKNEYEFTFMVGEPTIGEGIVLKLKDGRIVRTSRVVDFMIWRTGDIVIYTLNSIYRKYQIAA